MNKNQVIEFLNQTISSVRSNPARNMTAHDGYIRGLERATQIVDQLLEADQQLRLIELLREAKQPIRELILQYQDESVDDCHLRDLLKKINELLGDKPTK